MTKEEMMQVVTDNNVRAKLVGMLKKNFPQDTGDAEDWAQRALIRMFKHATDLYDAAGVEGYLHEAAISVAMHDKERQLERRKTLRELPRYKPHKDPMRHIDYKVDLERAIRKTTREQTLQAALWEIHFEKATWQDVLNDMPKVKNTGAWNMALARANAELKKEMRRKGYLRRN